MSIAAASDDELCPKRINSNKMEDEKCAISSLPRGHHMSNDISMHVASFIHFHVWKIFQVQGLIL